MSDFIAAYEPIIRSSVFFGLFLVLALSELFAPRSEHTEMKGSRWFTNLAIFIIDIVVLRLAFKAAAVGVAVWATSNGYGLFNVLDINPFLAGLIAFVFLDFAIWASHVASHKIPILWRVHRMHHADTSIDVTTALRFHPVEILLSMLFKVALIVLLGAPAIAVIIFEIVLNGCAMFNHSNLKLPEPVDRVLRMFIVTPDMHRIHHSSEQPETDSNYGFNLSIWDRLFSTYTHEPMKGHDGIEIGLKEYQDPRPSQLPWSLSLPFRKG
jgi:sterol desaturase/sphingolipid hydroxylase (fatty acid hydroxylase superfamily)